VNRSLNIQTRLTLWYLLIIALILVFFSLFIYFMLSRSLSDIAQRDSTITVVLPQDASLTEFSEVGWSPHPHLIANYRISREWLENLKSASGSLLSIYTPVGQVTINQAEFITPEMQGEQQVQLFLQPSADSPGSLEVLAYVRPVEVETTLAAFKRALFVVIPITAILAAGFGFFLIRRMLKPVNEITQIAREIEEKDLSRRIEVHSNDELGRLAVTLNQTFDRLQRAFNRERQFTSDASHELRTPLSIIQSEATLALKKERKQEDYRKSLDSISQEATRMSAIINKLLFLSRIDSNKDQLNLTRVNLTDFLTDVAGNIEVLCEDKSLQFSYELAENVQIKGDRVMLRELFLNLLDNAIKFTPAGGSVKLFMEKGQDQVSIFISDSGIGIGEEHLQYIFERFYRVDKTTGVENNGSGLGLAICKHIAELHKGHIQVESIPGQGSTFTVTLPVINE
jgi:heavy metal sensor kinase